MNVFYYTKNVYNFKPKIYRVPGFYGGMLPAELTWRCKKWTNKTGNSAGKTARGADGG